MNIELLTERNYQTWPSWFVVYESEDVFADYLHCEIKPLYRTGRIGRKIRRIMTYVSPVSDRFSNYDGKKWKLIWVMNANGYNRKSIVAK